MSTLPQPATPTHTGTLRPRHIVETRNGKPLDKCLCGYLWDVLPVPYDPAAGICAECLREFQRRNAA